MGVIQWNTTRYLSNVVDIKLDNITGYFRTIDRSRLPEAMAVTQSLDLRDVISYGLFDGAGKLLEGNLARIPPDLPLDEKVHLLRDGVSGGNGVYLYSSSLGFPNQTWNSSNYWVDVVFSTTP